MKFQEAVEELRAAGVPTPERDAQRLLAHAAEDAAQFAAFIKARAARQPVSQIIGTRAFWSHDFIVSSDVLDPRPDTETLIECALSEPFSRVLDLGTGSGCILLSLLGERTEATGLGTDISAAALGVARQNAARIGVEDRAQFQEADWLEGIAGPFDLVVSNPPYIDAEAYRGLMPDVRLWEPEVALTPGGDGLDAYRKILRNVPAVMTPGGRLLLEIGYNQAEPVSTLCAAAGFSNITVHDDLNGKPRVVDARSPK